MVFPNVINKCLCAILETGLLISNIDIDTIDITFVVSVSTILSCRGIGSSIDDTFMAVFSRYFDIDTFEKSK